MAGPTPETQLDFIIESYKLRIDYITKQFDRMWNRFQLLLGIDTALVGLLFAPQLCNETFRGISVFALLGIPLSLFWYVVGAEDRFLVVLYREQLRRDTDQVKNLLNLPDYIAVGDTQMEDTKVPVQVNRDWLQFRFSPISITRMIVLFPLLFLALFLVLAVGWKPRC